MVASGRRRAYLFTASIARSKPGYNAGLSPNSFDPCSTLKIQSTLNQRAGRICDFLAQLEDELRISKHNLECGSTVFDYGVKATGGLRAGVHLAEICLAGLADVKLTPGRLGQALSLYTDHPIAACLASQYAGWQLKAENFFAMGSGPMRAASAKEPLLKEIGFAEKPVSVVGVVETSQLPADDVCQQIAADCGVSPTQVTLCAAPTASIAGTAQVVARSLETALHKIHELGFDLNKVQSGFGTAPLPPVAANDLVGIGRTNDAILYGSEVSIWMRAEDDELADLVGKVPSQTSEDFGVPFKEIFDRYDGDFYKIDPLLFSPAKVNLVNLNTGRSFAAGEIRDDVLLQSFAG